MKLPAYLRCTKWETHCLQVSSKEWFPILDYKGFYAVVLMALVDADYKFIWADLNSAGSASKELAYDETIRSSAPDPLPSDYQDVPYFFIVDDAFPPPGDHTAIGVWTMKRGYLTTGPRQESGGKCLQNPGELLPSSVD